MLKILQPLLEWSYKVHPPSVVEQNNRLFPSLKYIIFFIHPLKNLLVSSSWRGRINIPSHSHQIPNGPINIPFCNFILQFETFDIFFIPWQLAYLTIFRYENTFRKLHNHHILNSFSSPLTLHIIVFVAWYVLNINILNSLKWILSVLLNHKTNPNSTIN